MLMSGVGFFFLNSCLYEAHAKSFYFPNTEVKQVVFTACSTKTLLASRIQNLSSFRLFSEFFSPLHVQVVARVNLLCLILGFAHICVSQLLQVVNCWIVSFCCHQ